MSRTVKIIVTPGSGDGRARATARRIRQRLVRRGFRVSVRSFHDLAALNAWARSAPRDFAYLLAVGGDATLSAAATAAMRVDVPFVPVPRGFGNVFASVLGYSGEAASVVRLLHHGEVRRVDVGRSGDEVFLSHRSYGLLEWVQQAAETGRGQPRTRFFRYLWYYHVARRVLFEMPRPAIDVEIDGSPVIRDATLVTVANVETYHGFLNLTPKASPIDGRFDVLLVPRVGKLRLLFRLLKIKLRVPGRWKGVMLYRGRRVVVTMDGQREELHTVRGALPVLVPPGAIAALERRQVHDDDAPVVSAP